MSHEYIKKIETFTVGGGAQMDFITLTNGQVIGIDNETICLYDNLDDFYEGRDGDFAHVQMMGWSTNSENIK